MGKEQFLAVMPYISADLIGMIAKKETSHRRRSYRHAVRLQALCGAGAGGDQGLAVQHGDALFAF